MPNMVRLHRWQPTRLCRPWDSPGKNTGVGCHFLLQCMKVKSESEFTQSCPTLSNPMDCSVPGSSIHGIFQARVLEWGAIAIQCFFAALPVIWNLGLLHMSVEAKWHAQIKERKKERFITCSSKENTRDLPQSKTGEVLSLEYMHIHEGAWAENWGRGWQSSSFGWLKSQESGKVNIP